MRKDEKETNDVYTKKVVERYYLYRKKGRSFYNEYLGNPILKN